METLLVGAVIGLSVAVPPGPNAAICMRRTLSGGRSVGLRCGLGAASAHAVYATLAVIGVGRTSDLVRSSTTPLHVAGGLVLVALAVHLGRAGAPAVRQSNKSAYLVTLAAGLGNPLTILYFTAAMAVGTIPAGGGLLMVAGVFAGSAAWWTALTCIVAAVNQRLDDRNLLRARRFAASVIGGCGLLAVVTAL